MELNRGPMFDAVCAADGDEEDPVSLKEMQVLSAFVQYNNLIQDNSLGDLHSIPKRYHWIQREHTGADHDTPMQLRRAED